MGGVSQCYGGGGHFSVIWGVFLSAMEVVGISQCYGGGGHFSVLWGVFLNAVKVVGISQCYGGVCGGGT